MSAFLTNVRNTLMRRIALRGRDFERDIRPDYLQQLNQLYDAWIEGFALCPVLTVTADYTDFIENEADLLQVTSQIIDRLQGLIEFKE